MYLNLYDRNGYYRSYGRCLRMTSPWTCTAEKSATLSRHKDLTPVPSGGTYTSGQESSPFISVTGDASACGSKPKGGSEAISVSTTCGASAKR